MILNRFILMGLPQEVNFDNDNTMIIGTGAAESINFAAGTSNVFFTAGGGDRVSLANDLEDYTITASGNQLRLEDNDGNVITLIVGGSSGNASTVEFADGEAELYMSFGVDSPQAHLGDAVILDGESLENPGDVNLTPSEVYQSDLEVSELVVNPSEPEAGETFSMDVTIAETADVETENLTASLVIAGTGIDETVDIGTLQAGETTVTFDGLSLPDNGDYTVEVTADADNADAVTDDRVFSVLPPEDPDAVIEIQAIVVDPSEPEAGETFSVDVSIAETADVETENLTASLVIAGTDIDETIDIGALQAGEATVTFDGLSLPDNGDYTVEVTADADNADSIEHTESFKILEAEQIFSPTDEEQLMLTLINRARLDPEGEADRYGIDLNEGLAPEEISPEPKQPLAFNPTLILAARDHSLWMLSEDKFRHTGEEGTSPGDRMEKAGYQFEPPWWWGENIAWQGSSIAPEDYYDFIFHQHEGLFLSPGHRTNTLGENFREAGVGSLVGEFDGYENSLMSTVKFASSGDSVFLTGTVYEDLNHSDTYSPAEGLGDILVEAGGNNTTTWDSGGYVLELKPGSYDVVFSGGPLDEPIEREINMGENNVLLDIILPPSVYEFAGKPDQLEMIDVFEAEAMAPEAQDIKVMGMTAFYGDEQIV